MNKFLKHKLRVLACSLSNTIIPHKTPTDEFAVRINNRVLNAALNALRSLPEEFALRNNPEIAALVKSINVKVSAAETHKQNINKVSGALAGTELDVSKIADTGNAEYVTQQLQQRRECKASIVKQLSEKRALVDNRIEALIREYPSARRHLQTLLEL